MALKTIGTAATTTLSGLQIAPNYNATPVYSDTDWATLQQAILDDENLLHPIWPGALQRKGVLFLPRNRGVIKLYSGDWVATDPNGWPIVIANCALPQTLTATGTQATSKVIMFATSVIALGWQIGMPVTGTLMGVSAVITSISPDGLTVGVSVTSTGNGAQTVTVNGSGWTHS